MTPGQIALVEETLTWVDLDALADDFYRRALTATPAMFTSDPVVQRARFAAELAEIVRSIRSLDDLASTARPLGARHHGYGVRAAHYRLMGDALLASLASAIGDRWNTEIDEAWTVAYNLTAEIMMMGAREDDPPS